MTARDWKVALFGALCAFGVVAGNDGHVIAAGVLFAVGNLCLWWARERKGVEV